MDSRQIRGLQIARTSRLRRNGYAWTVPSQNGSGTYTVNMGHTPTCNCPDCKFRQEKCKHIWAVEYRMKQDIDEQGKMTRTEEVRMTYSQNWSAYNKAQTQEGQFVMKLLSELCSSIENRPYQFGRPTLPMADMLFASAMKVYSTFSLRRFVSYMKMAKEQGYTNRVCSYASISNYMRRKDMTDTLMEMIKESSKVLSSVETDFAIDSSGFSTCRFQRWYDFKYGRNTKWRIWMKANIVCGVKTNIITAVKITESTRSDIKSFKELVKTTSENFDVSEISADKAYLSKENLNLVDEIGGKAFIPYKKNSVGKARGSALWKKMWHYYQFHREEFLEHYHKRSNAETVFHMMKAKFGDSLRSKDKTAQANELLLKVLCHNLCVVIQEIHELGLKPQFSSFKEDEPNYVYEQAD